MMVFKTKNIVNRVTTESDYLENASLFADKKTIYELTVRITGLILILWTVPDFVYKLVGYVKQLRDGDPVAVRDANFIKISIVKILIGVFAILLAKSISEYLGKEKNTENRTRELPHFLLSPKILLLRANFRTIDKEWIYLKSY
jgi:hypothetical protein